MNLRNTEPSLLERIVLKALSKLTFTTGGLRIDTGGALVTANIASSQTLASVTTVNAVNNTSMGRTTPDGTGVLMTYSAYQNGYRSNIIKT